MSKQRLWFVTYMYGNDGAVMICNTSQLNKLKRLTHTIQVIEILNDNQLNYYYNLIRHTLNQIDPTEQIRNLMISPITYEEYEDKRIRLIHSDVPLHLKGYFN